MSNERDNRAVDLASWALQNLEPIRTDTMAGGGFHLEASKINTARVAVDQLLRQIRQEERRFQDSEYGMRRIKFLLRKLFSADDDYGTGFHNTDKWREAYDALRAEVGLEVRDK